MRKLCSILIFVLTAIWLLGTGAQLAHAKVGLATGFGFGISNPFAAHIGPVYWTPGDSTTVAGYRQASAGPTELEQFIATVRKDEARIKKAQCLKNFAGYFGRHGVTTPRPLKGFSGCKKYALDNAYWKQRRGQPVVHNPVTAGHMRTTAEIAVHNMFIPWK